MPEMAVAPLAGAWIEIDTLSVTSSNNWVAPLAGAGIEIYRVCQWHKISCVAPLAGAWIEISSTACLMYAILGRSPRGSVD